jgi:hypothetical protein
MMQAYMIYAQESVARMIAGKLTKSYGVEYLVEKVTTCFKVRPMSVTAKPPKPAPKMMGADFSKTPKAVKTWAQGDAVIIEMKFRGESTSYVDAWTDDGKPISFGKSTLIAWDIVQAGERVLLKMPVSIAKKRGLLK